MSGRAWLTLGVLALWLPATYVSLFLALVHYMHPFFFEPGPPDGVGRYIVFSADEGTDRFLAAAFWPPLHVIEHYRIALHPSKDPGWGKLIRLSPNGWQVCLGTHDPPVDSCAVSLAMVEAMLTGFLVYRVCVFLHDRRQKRREWTMPPNG